MHVTSQLCLLFLIALARGQDKQFHVIKQWNYANFTWPSAQVLQSALSSGLYVPTNSIISGIRHFDDHYYLTLPRLRAGVPATLARFPSASTSVSPLLEPYPSWALNAADASCDHLQNVQNIEVDARGQLWILDGGRAETLTQQVSKCSPKLLVHDLKNNRTSTVYVFPEDVASKNGSFLYDLVIDTSEGTFAYITDNSANDPGIIVFSLQNLKSWKFRNSDAFRADPTSTQFSVNGVQIAAPLNIAGIALGPKLHTSNDKIILKDERVVYFQAISSLNLYAINTTTLKNEALARDAQKIDAHIQNLGRLESQSSAITSDNMGNVYLGLLTTNAIGKWDTKTNLSSNVKLIARDPKFLEWPSAFGFDQGGNLSVAVNRLNQFIFGKFNMEELNFWILSARLDAKSYLVEEDFSYEQPEVAPSAEPTPEESVPSAEPTSEALNSTTERPTRVPMKSGGVGVVGSVLVLMFSVFVGFV